MKYVIYNPKSNDGEYEELLAKIDGENSAMRVNVFDEEKYQEAIKAFKDEDDIYIIGGDGTLNCFVNKIKNFDLKCKIYFVSNGTGNDFLNDVKDNATGNIVLVNDYIKKLPTVIVKGERRLFINGIGFGIDGYCCEVGDKLHAEGRTNISYAGIAIKGLLFHYKPPKATVTVDGITKTYKRCWLAPTMKGKFYGGGMMIAPAQDRNNPDNLITNVVLHKKGKLKTLIVFPSIFKGEHVKHTEMVDIRSGHNIKVVFDRPIALQIDGETILNVTEYEVEA